MKNSNLHIIKITTVLIFFGLLSLGINGCSSSSSDSDGNGGDGNGNNGGPTFNSGDIAADGTFSYTFEEEGTVEYYCGIHAPDMQGELTVSEGADISGEYTISMEATQFSPSSVTIAPNTKITWVNNDGFPHRVMDGNPSSSNGNNGGY